jgi:hypothetical protein
MGAFRSGRGPKWRTSIPSCACEFVLVSDPVRVEVKEKWVGCREAAISIGVREGAAKAGASDITVTAGNTFRLDGTITSKDVLDVSGKVTVEASLSDL